MAIQHCRDLGEFDYGAPVALTPLIRRVICENPTPFTYRGTGTYIVGHGEVAVIDAGPRLAGHLDDLLRALAPGETVSAALVTHTHSDHSPLTGDLTAATGALSYGYGPHADVWQLDPDDRVDFSHCISAAEQDKYRAEFEALPEELRREGADTDFVPDVALCDGDIVSGDGWTLRAIHTPGHCSNHLCYELLEERALFSGDHVMGWATSVVGPPDGSMSDYLASLRKLLEFDHERYWPTHGPPIDNPAAYVRSFIDHRIDRERQILEHLRPGPCRIADFVPKMYEGYDKRLWYPAASSVYAHLLHLIECGQVRVATGSAEPRLTSVYELTTAALHPPEGPTPSPNPTNSDQQPPASPQQGAPQLGAPAPDDSPPGGQPPADLQSSRRHTDEQ